MHLQSLLSLVPLSSIPFRSSEGPGKPTKLLQIGRFPSLGYNTWNAYGCNINETILLDNARFMKEAGLLEAGYRYIVIDGPLSLDSACNVANPHRFPSGMKRLADKIHDMGFSFGIYESAGRSTCMGLPGSLDHEQQDAELFASWGVDYLKYDNCGDGEPLDSLSRMTHMRDALLSQSHSILFALCQGGVEGVHEWGNRTGHSWRISDDIFPSWDRMMWIAEIQSRIWNYSGPYGYNDMDMLEVGNGRLTIDEQRTHFNLWALSKSPLLIGTHLPSISMESLSIFLNKQILAINQDPLSIPIQPYHPPPISSNQPPSSQSPFHTFGQTWHWYGPLSTGETIIMVINLSPRPMNILLQWRHIPCLKGSKAKWFQFRDVTMGEGGWEGYSSVGIGVSDVKPHASFVLIVGEKMDSGRLGDDIAVDKRTQAGWILDGHGS